jgi:hypothetical protein
LNIIAINRRTPDGMISVAMAVTYEFALNAYSVDEDSFIVPGRRVLACYVHSRAEIREHRQNTTGRYIILELNPISVPENVFPNREVVQCKPVRLASCKVVMEEKPIMPCCVDTILQNGGHRGLYRAVPGGPVLHFFQRAPEDYHPSRSYPLKVVFCQQHRDDKVWEQGIVLVFESAEGWEHRPDDDPLFQLARRVFQDTVRHFSIVMEDIQTIGMDADRADRLLDALFPSRNG